MTKREIDVTVELDADIGQAEAEQLVELTIEAAIETYGQLTSEQIANMRRELRKQLGLD